MTNPVIDCLMQHRSIRKYRSEPIPEDTIRTLIEAGDISLPRGKVEQLVD